jgi:hypothetical protein
MVVGCLNTIDETVCGSPYCVEHEHHPVGKASFEVVRQVLVDVRESTGYAGWTKHKEGWDMLETYTTMEELWAGSMYDDNIHRRVTQHLGGGVTVKDGNLDSIKLENCNLTGTSHPLLALMTARAN